MSSVPAASSKGEARVSRAAPTGARAFAQRYINGDEVARLIVTVAAGVILLLTATLVFELWKNSHLAREKFGWAFLVTKVWDPNAEQFGARSEERRVGKECH